MYTKLIWPTLNLKDFIEDEKQYNCILDLECSTKVDYNLALSKIKVYNNLILVVYNVKFPESDLIFSTNYQTSRELFCYDLKNKSILSLNSLDSSLDGFLAYRELYSSVSDSYKILDCRLLYKELTSKYTDKLKNLFDDYFKDSSHMDLFNRYASRISTNRVINNIKPLYIKNAISEQLEFKIHTDKSDYFINLIYTYISDSNYLDNIAQKVFEENIQELSIGELSAYVNYNILSKAFEDAKSNPSDELVTLKNIYNCTKDVGLTLTVTTKNGETLKVNNDLDLTDCSYRTVKGYDHISIKDIDTIKFNGKVLYTA